MKLNACVDALHHANELNPTANDNDKHGNDKADEAQPITKRQIDDTA